MGRLGTRRSQDDALETQLHVLDVCEQDGLVSELFLELRVDLLVDCDPGPV